MARPLISSGGSPVSFSASRRAQGGRQLHGQDEGSVLNEAAGNGCGSAAGWWGQLAEISNG